MKDTIKNGTLVFEVDDGIKKTTDCKVNMKTREIYNCDLDMMFSGWNLLHYEYVIIDGEIYDCRGTSSICILESDYWYDDM